MSATPCTLDGVTYPSQRAAARALGITHKTVAYRLDPERHRAYTKNWHRAHPERSRELRRKWAGRPAPTRLCPPTCEICNDYSPRALHLDHDHVTGRFRGWLCSRCNTALGLFRDDRVLLHFADDYLRRSL